jgi:hypothetical protein
MFDHAHFLFACTEFTRIVNFPLRTAEERMSYQAVRNESSRPVQAWRSPKWQFFLEV